MFVMNFSTGLESPRGELVAAVERTSPFPARCEQTGQSRKLTIVAQVATGSCSMMMRTMFKDTDFRHKRGFQYLDPVQNVALKRCGCGK